MYEEKENNSNKIEQKVQQEKLLSLAELLSLKEIPFTNLNNNFKSLDLILQYSQHSKFQIRLCEKSYLMTTLLPLCSQSSIETIKYAVKALANLSQNIDTHEKIFMSNSLAVIFSLIKNNIQYEVTQYCIETLSNLVVEFKNHKQILSRVLIDLLVISLLDNVQGESQTHILKILYYFSLKTENNHNYEQVHLLLIKKKYIYPVLRCLSSHKEVAHQCLLFVRNLIINENNQDRLMNLNLAGRLVHIYKTFKKVTENQNILLPIAMCFEELLKTQKNQIKLAKQRYINIFLEMLRSTNFHLCYLASVCLSHISEIMESHDKLVESNIMNLMGIILRNSKDIKLHRQSCIFLANLSWNPKYQQIFISKNLIDILMATLTSHDKTTLMYCVIALSNLSCAQNFHQNLSQMNLKLLIQVLDSNDDQNDQNVLIAASTTLANISADFQYHIHFLKEPELTIIIKILQFSEDLKLIQNILIIITNICTNAVMIPQFLSSNCLEIILKLFDKEKPELVGYLATAISGLCISQESRKKIIENEIIRKLTQIIYKTDQEVKKQILISLMTMLFHSDELHDEFFNCKGIVLLVYFLSKSDQFHKYLALKCLVLLSRYEKNYEKIAEESIFQQISKCINNNDIRIIKESIRFFVNTFIHKRNNQNLAQNICDILEQSIVYDEPDILGLNIFALMILSENQFTHVIILQKTKILEELCIKPTECLVPHSEFLSTFLMNMSLKTESIRELLQYKMITKLKELCQYVDPKLHPYFHTFINQILRNNCFQQFYEQKGHHMLIYLLQLHNVIHNSEILDSLSLICQSEFDYPEQLLQIIPFLIKQQNVAGQEQEIRTKLQILAFFSFKSESIQYFKTGQIDEMLIQYQDNDYIKVYLDEICLILANISRDEEICKLFIDSPLIKNIFNLSFQSQNQLVGKEIMRFLANLTSLTNLKNFETSKEMIDLMLQYLQNFRESENDQSEEIIIISILISIINLTRLNFKNTIQLLKANIVEILVNLLLRTINQKISALSLMAISNILIFKESIENNKNQILKIFENNQRFILNDQNKIEKFLIFTSFLKIFHNVISTVEQFIDISIIKSIIKKTMQFFEQVNYNQNNLLNIIINSINQIILNPELYQLIRVNKLFIKSIFQLVFNQYDKIDSQLRSAALFSASIFFYNEEQLEFYNSLINFEQIFNQLYNIFNSLKSEQEKIWFLNIFTSLTYIKEIHPYLLKFSKNLQIITEIINQKIMNDQYFELCLFLLGNISYNNDFHNFFANQEIIEFLSKKFLQKDINQSHKILITKIFSNLSFTFSLHQNLIDYGCFDIFQQQYKSLKQCSQSENSPKKLLKAINIIDNQYINSSDSNYSDSQLSESKNSQTNNNENSNTNIDINNAICKKSNNNSDQNSIYVASIIAILNFAKNQQIFLYLKEQDNILSNLDLIQDLEKTLQIKLLESAIQFVIDEQSENLSTENQQHKLYIFKNIMINIVSLLKTKSIYLTKNICVYLPSLAKNNMIFDIQFPRKELFDLLIDIVFYHKNQYIKKLTCLALCNLTRSELVFIDNDQINKILIQLHKITDKKMQKILKNQFSLAKFECFIILFLRLLSNSITYGYKNKQIHSYFQQNNMDIILYRYIIFGYEFSVNILNETLLTLCFFYQNKDISKFLDGFLIFDGLSSLYKEKLEDDDYFKNLLSAFIFIYLKNKQFILTDIEPCLIEYEIQKDLKLQQSSQNKQIIKKQIIKRRYSDSFIQDIQKEKGKKQLMIDDQQFDQKRKSNIININFILVYIQFNILSEIQLIEDDSVLDTNKSEDQLDMEKDTDIFQSLMNLSYLENNHAIIFKTNIISLLFRYLKKITEKNGKQSQSSIYFIINSFTNLALSPLFFDYINVDHLLDWLQDLQLFDSIMFQNYSSIFILLMIHNLQSDIFNQKLLYILDNIIINLLSQEQISEKNDEVFDRIVSFFHLTLRNQKQRKIILNNTEFFKKFFNTIISQFNQKYTNRFILNFSKLINLFTYYDINQALYSSIKDEYLQFLKFSCLLSQKQDFLNMQKVNQLEQEKQAQNQCKILEQARIQQLQNSLIINLLQSITTRINYINLIFQSLISLVESVQKQNMHNCIKFIYSDQVQQSDYELTNNENQDQRFVFNFQNLYEIIKNLSQQSINIVNNNFISYSELCYNMIRILVNIQDAQFEQILNVIHFLVEKVILGIQEKNFNLKNQEIQLILSYLTGSLYLIQECNKEITEKKVASILDIFLNNQFFLNSIYKQYITKQINLFVVQTLAFIHFKRVEWDDSKILNEIIQVIMQFVTPSSSNILKYFVLVNIKKIFLQYDLNNSQYSFKEFQYLLEIITDYIRDTINTFENILNNTITSRNKIQVKKQKVIKYNTSSKSSFSESVDSQKSDQKENISIQNIDNNIHNNITDEQQRQFEILFLKYCLECLILFVHTNQLQQNINQLNCLKYIINLAKILIKILYHQQYSENTNYDLQNYPNLENHQIFEQNKINLLFEIYSTSYDDINDIFKLCCIFLNQTTYYEKFIERFFKNSKISFLIDTLMSNHKIQQLISLNSINNLIEVKGYFLFKKIYEIIQKKIEVINKICCQSSFLRNNLNLDLLINLLEISYQNNDIFPEELQNSQMKLKYEIALTLTNCLVEKNRFKLNKKIMEIFFNEVDKNISFENRVYIIMIKNIQHNESFFIEQKELVLNYIYQQFSIKKQQMDDISDTQLNQKINLQIINTFLNTDIQQIQGIQSIENVFFWEFMKCQLNFKELNKISIILQLSFLKMLLSRVLIIRNYVLESKYLEKFSSALEFTNYENKDNQIIVFLFGEIIYILSNNKKVKFDTQKNNNILNNFYNMSDNMDNDSIKSLKQIIENQLNKNN